MSTLLSVFDLSVHLHICQYVWLLMILSVYCSGCLSAVLYIWVEILLHSIFDLSMSLNQQYSWHPVNFSKNQIIFSPCSHKIYPLSTNLKQSSALRTFSNMVYSHCQKWVPKPSENRKIAYINFLTLEVKVSKRKGPYLGPEAKVEKSSRK